MQNELSFKDMLITVANTLPENWGPRREQPEWDRDFNGRADIQSHFQTKSDKARDWMTYALAFSETLVSGYEGLPEVRKVGRDALALYTPKGKYQF